MTFDWLFEYLRLHPTFVPAVMFVVTLGEAIVFTSPLVPATVLCLGLGAVHQAAGGDFASILIAATVGVFVGDVISYQIGHRYREEIGGWWPFKKRPDWLASSIRFMQKWGTLGLVGSKFLGPVRWIGPAVCGILRMPFTPFLVATAFASLLWSVAILAPPFYGMRAATGG